MTNKSNRLSELFKLINQVKTVEEVRAISDEINEILVHWFSKEEK